MKHLFLLGVLSISLTHAMEQNRTPYSDKPLHQAVYDDNLSEIRSLLPKADVNEYDRHGYTPLHHSKSVDAAQLLLEKNPDVNAPLASVPGHSPLHNIVQHDTPERRALVLFLLQKGANVNGPNKYGTRPLGLVDWGANPKEMVSLLLQHKALIKSAADGMPGYLDQTIFHGHTDLARILLDAGANPDGITWDSRMFLEGKVPKCDRSEIAALIRQAKSK